MYNKRTCVCICMKGSTIHGAIGFRFVFREGIAYKFILFFKLQPRRIRINSRERNAIVFLLQLNANPFSLFRFSLACCYKFPFRLSLLLSQSDQRNSSGFIRRSSCKNRFPLLLFFLSPRFSNRMMWLF